MLAACSSADHTTSPFILLTRIIILQFFGSRPVHIPHLLPLFRSATMLCPIPTEKSNSSWLDRLRSARGFPPGSDLDLDCSVTPQNTVVSNLEVSGATDTARTHIGREYTRFQPRPQRAQPVLDCPQAAEAYCGDGEKDWFGLITNVLSDLFVTGDPNAISTICSKKSSRKQRNPRFCPHSKSSSVDERCSDDPSRRDQRASVAAPSSGDHSLAEAKEAMAAEQEDVACADDAEDEEFWSDLKGFSRTEVTVIDTSYRSWKFEKWLFRRKNVWKVRDKKCKWKSVGKKKRELGLSDDSVGGGKKPKVTILPLSSLKEGRRPEPTSTSHEGPNQPDKRGEYNKNTDAIARASLHGFPKKLRDGGRFPFNALKDDLTAARSGANALKGTHWGQ